MNHQPKHENGGNTIKGEGGDKQHQQRKERSRGSNTNNESALKREERAQQRQQYAPVSTARRSIYSSTYVHWQQPHNHTNMNEGEKTRATTPHEPRAEEGESE